MLAVQQRLPPDSLHAQVKPKNVGRSKKQGVYVFENIVGKWGFLIAGILFLIAAIMPFAEGQTVKVSFFVIGIAFLVIGTAIARKRRADTPSKR